MLNNEVLTDDRMQRDWSAAAGVMMPDLRSIGSSLLSRLPIQSIDLIPLVSTTDKTELRARYATGKIFACDFFIGGAENQRPTSSGYVFENENIENIDHHAEAPRMCRIISSGNLAIDYVLRHGPVPSNDHVVISHTDCDSVISSLVMRGLLPPDEIFGAAVIAADHTGAENEIADLLQAIDRRRSIHYSARNLGLLLTGQPLESDAARYLAERMSGREILREKCASGEIVRQRGPLTVIELDGSLRNEFLPALFPDAVVIMSYESGDTENSSVVRMRLGAAAPEGFTIFNLKLETNCDPNYGGRWNAGSNKRGGGTTTPIDEYIRLANQSLQRAWDTFEDKRRARFKANFAQVERPE